MIGKTPIDARPVNDKSHIYYDCRCDCGSNKITQVKTGDLTRKHTTSCGCLKKIAGTINFKKWRVGGGVNSNRKFVGDLSGTAWYRIQSNAKDREIIIEITKDYAWNLFLNQHKKCALTGLLLVLSPFFNDKNGNTASLDRIDSSKGYIEGNVQWVHKDVNLMKLDFSQEYFKKICKLVSEKA